MSQRPNPTALVLLLCSLPGLVAAQEAPARAPAGSESPAPAAQPRTRGLLARTDAAYQGYTLVAPLRSTSTFLVDLEGAVVHEWPSDAPPGQAVYLRENGHLLRAERVDNDTFWGGGQGGRVRELDPDGQVVWEYVCSDATRLSHHDFELLPNGHLLLIAWERRTGEQAFEAGRDPRLLQAGELWPDMLLEIELTPPSGGKVVWEWHAFDHLIQERAPDKSNYGRVAEHPERIDVNADRPVRSDDEERRELEDLRRLGYAGDAPERAKGDDAGPAGAGRRPDGPGFPGGPGRGGDWLHTNALDYSPELDLIALSIHSLSEVWIIDHSTTTAEARSSRGGRYGRGGDLLARFGNPRVHAGGSEADQTLFGQHDVQWIPAGLPGAGNLLLFNNGMRSQRGWSSADELAIDLSPESVARGLPSAKLVWTYTSEQIFSDHISGAQRLPNGNTSICAGEGGRVVEVTPKGEVAWDFASPLRGDARPGGRGGRDSGGAGARAGEPAPPGAPPAGAPQGRAPAGDGPRPRGPGPRAPGALDHGLFQAPRYGSDHPGVKALLARPAPRFELEAGRLVLPLPVEFVAEGIDPTPESDRSLAHVAAWLRSRKDVTKARIEVHVDLAGDTGLELSKRRARALARSLVGRGVDCTRLVIVGFGDTKPVEDATTPAARAANRRVEVHVAELRGLAIGGAPLDGGGASAGDPCSG